MENVNSVENAAVITCYATSDLMVNCMVFTDNSYYYPPKNAHTGHARVLKITGDQHALTDRHRFLGVAIGDPDHSFVAVAVSGVCTIACSCDDLNDAHPSDLLRCVISEGRLLRANTLTGQYRTVKLEPIHSSQNVSGATTVGVLLAHGRTPMNEARILLLPGLEHLPAAPPPADIFDTAVPSLDEGPTHRSETLQRDFVGDAQGSVMQLTLQQLKNVIIPNSSSFSTEVAQFIEMVSSFAEDNPAAFARVSE